MITTDLWRLSHPDAPMAASYGPLASCERWRDQESKYRPVESFLIERVPSCGCCGATRAAANVYTWGNGQSRCGKHAMRNPCAIEGCTRTTSAPDGRTADDAWLCPEHWRRFVPPRSRRRRAYHAFFRKAKRHGWDDRLRAQFRRFWDQLVRTARAKATTGTINVSEINRMFGW